MLSCEALHGTKGHTPKLPIMVVCRNPKFIILLDRGLSFSLMSIPRDWLTTLRENNLRKTQKIIKK